MIRKRWCTVGVLTLSSIGLIAPSSLHAQHGPGRQTPGSQSRQEPRQHQGPAYDTTTESTFKGTVENVNTWGHTMVAEEGMGPQEILSLRVDSGTVEIHVGPVGSLTEKGIRKGDTLEVTGSRVTVGQSRLVLAREIRKRGQMWTVRDAAGSPLWSPSGTEARGFWTKKRVLLAALVVKAGVAAALLLK